MKDEGGARYPSDYFFCLPVPAVFAHLNMIFDIYYSRSSPKSRGVGIIKNYWEHDTLLITSSVYQYLQYDFSYLFFKVQNFRYMFQHVISGVSITTNA